MKTGIGLIAQERMSHHENNKWTPEHDDEHLDSELADAASCYTDIASALVNCPDVDLEVLKRHYIEGYHGNPYWPWEANSLKPSRDPVENLVKAGALIAAEIDRLLRLRENDD